MRWTLYLMYKPPEKGSTIYAWIDAPNYKTAWRAALKVCAGVHTSCMRLERK
jgi:hypothetical protein